MSRHVPTFVVDESALVREGLTGVLAGTRFRISAAGSDLEEISKRAAHIRDVLVLVGSNAYPDEDFSDLRRFKLEHEHSKIIVLGEPSSPRHLLTAISAGVDGFLSEQISSDALIKSLDLVWIGQTVIPSSWLRMIIEHGEPASRGIAFLSPAPEPKERSIADPAPCKLNIDRLHRLSGREQLIIGCLTLGASNKAIARELNMAEATVKVHLKAILRKIRVSNRTQVAVWALNRGSGALVEESP